ncbi:protein FORGETTER 1 [Forsythia ovata]|uniref:Protein FORGETTER 1 n=1 Tax=Forsythia ovata TaxID=205694 RepID=A0ABD1WQH9_9LAMI
MAPTVSRATSVLLVGTVGRRLQEVNVLSILLVWGAIEKALSKQARRSHWRILVVYIETTIDNQRIVVKDFIQVEIVVEKNSQKIILIEKDLLQRVELLWLQCIYYGTFWKLKTHGNAICRSGIGFRTQEYQLAEKSYPHNSV